MTPTAAKFACELRQLTRAQLTDAYLPLRRKVLHDELGWTTRKIESDEDLLDEYDASSVSFGLFLDRSLCGAVRLIKADEFAQLPSGSVLSGELIPPLDGPVAEISRLMVNRQFRNSGIANVLTKRCLIASQRDRIANTFITVGDTRAHRAFLEGIGFSLVKSGFSYRDSLIDPREPAATFGFHLTCSISAATVDRRLVDLESEVAELGPRLRPLQSGDSCE